MLRPRLSYFAAAGISVALLFGACFTHDYSTRNTDIARAPALVAVAKAADPTPALAVVGPETATAGQRVIFRLEGTPPLDSAQPLGNQLDWASKVVIKVVGAAEITPETSLQLMVPLAVQVRVECTLEKAGDYWLIVGWHNQPAQLLIHKIKVTSPNPQPTPDPTPDPTPGPTPPGPRYAVIVEESSQRTPAVAAVIKDKSLRDWAVQAGHVLRVVDRDGQVPADLAPYVKLATEGDKKLPRLIVATQTGQVLTNVELPTTTEAVKAAIK